MIFSGTFAVVSIMVGKVVLTHSTLHTPTGEGEAGYSPVQIATAICFIVGIIQIVMYFLRLGIISSLLSEPLVSGFTTGAAIHVLTSQIKDLFGITLPPVVGSFEIIKVSSDSL
jgi:solute carrier family 26, other